MLWGVRGEVNGHSRLLMDAAVYVNVAAMSYTILLDPGPYAQHGVGDSTVERADANVIHKKPRRIYDIDENVDATLKQYVIAVVEETYLFAKKQRYMGFHVVSSKSLMDHFIDRYRNIRVLDLKACRQALADPIEVDQPIDAYFQWVDDVIQFSQDRNTPFTPEKFCIPHTMWSTGQGYTPWRSSSGRRRRRQTKPWQSSSKSLWNSTTTS